MKYDGIILDNDGVLIELYQPGQRYEQAIKKLFKKKGVNPSKRDVKTFIPGYTPEHVQKTCEKHGINTEQFWEEKEDVTYRLQKRMILNGYKTLYPDIDHLGDIDLPKGIVSNNQQAIIDFIAEKYSGIDFDCSLGREKSLKGLWRMKPETYYVQKCIDEMGLENPLFVGDSSADIEAAHKLGIDSVFLRREHREGYYVTKKPTYEINSLKELKKILS